MLKDMQSFFFLPFFLEIGVQDKIYKIKGLVFVHICNILFYIMLYYIYMIYVCIYVCVYIHTYIYMVYIYIYIYIYGIYTPSVSQWPRSLAQFPIFTISKTNVYLVLFTYSNNKWITDSLLIHYLIHFTWSLDFRKSLLLKFIINFLSQNSNIFVTKIFFFFF
jgi:hypothetical protein